MSEDKQIVKENSLAVNNLAGFGAEKPSNINELPDKTFEQKELVSDPAKVENNFGDKSGIGTEHSKTNFQVAQNTVHNEEVKKIEAILADGMEEFYREMSEKDRKEFKKAGEDTAQKINEIVQRANFKVKKIIDLIRKWLYMVPGINKFFIEQEVKIKTDRIISDIKR